MSDASPLRTSAVPAPPSTATPSKRRRRWFQFSLRTLLVLTAAVSIWASMVARSVHRQRAAVAEVKRLGGWAYYDYQLVDDEQVGFKIVHGESSVAPWLLDWLGWDFFHDIVYVSVVYDEVGGVRKDNEQLSDEIKTVLPMFPKLRVLLLKETQVTDDCLRTVAELNELEWLFCWDTTEASDVGVAALGGLRNLKFLHLSSRTDVDSRRRNGSLLPPTPAISKITDESLRVFGGMRQLEGLSLQGGAFSDQGLVHLQRLLRLKTLWVDLGQTNITDAGLKSLAGLANLEELGIQQCAVTDQGVAELQAAIPKLKRIYR